MIEKNDEMLYLVYSDQTFNVFCVKPDSVTSLSWLRATLKNSRMPRNKTTLVEELPLLS